MSQDGERAKLPWLLLIFGLALVSGLLAVAFGEQRAWLWVAASLVGLGQTWVISRGPNTTQRMRLVARTYAPIVILAGLAIVAGYVGLERAAEAKTGSAFLAFAVVILNVALIVWLIRRTIRRSR